MCDGNTRVCTRFSLFTPYRTCIKDMYAILYSNRLKRIETDENRMKAGGIMHGATNINRNKDVVLSETKNSKVL